MNFIRRSIQIWVQKPYFDFYSNLLQVICFKFYTNRKNRKLQASMYSNIYLLLWNSMSRLCPYELLMFHKYIFISSSCVNYTNYWTTGRSFKPENSNIYFLEWCGMFKCNVVWFQGTTRLVPWRRIFYKMPYRKRAVK